MYAEIAETITLRSRKLWEAGYWDLACRFPLGNYKS